MDTDTETETEPAEYVSVWGCRRSSTNLCQTLVDDHTDADLIQHGDAWKHGYPHNTNPRAANLVVTKHPMAWLQSEEEWRFRGGPPSRMARHVRNLACDIVAYRDPFRAVGMKWGLALDKWAALMEVWARLPRAAVVRYEDLLRDPRQALAPLEDHGIDISDDIQLPGGRVQPTKTGPTELDDSFDAGYYLDYEWASAYTSRDRIGIDHYIERHGQQQTWTALGYGTYRPWVEDRPPDSADAIDQARDDSVHFYRRAELLQGGEVPT
jgi:hypothetical protein